MNRRAAKWRRCLGRVQVDLQCEKKVVAEEELAGAVVAVAIEVGVGVEIVGLMNTLHVA